MDEEAEPLVPLQDQRVFGAGVKRKRVTFVPAEAISTQNATKSTNHSASAVGDRYLSLVLEDRRTTTESRVDKNVDPKSTASTIIEKSNAENVLCEICDLPIESGSDGSFVGVKPHESSLVHQLCLPHSRPPSHLDRNRHGLKYLSSYGWDPDSGLGLGATGAGIRVPIKGKLKNDTIGLGMELEGKKGTKVSQEKQVKKQDAKSVRKRVHDDTIRRKRLQEMFYYNEDVERYLGSGP